MSPAKARAGYGADEVVGFLGCAGLLIGLPVVFFMGRITDWRALVVLGVFGLMIYAGLKLSDLRSTAARERNRKEILARLRPGVHFKAHGSAGSPMEGRVIRVIDDDTIEAYVGYADRQGGKEQGPFPIANIDSVDED